ncbi:transposase [Streptomyces lividans]
MPERYGPWATLYTRFAGGRRTGRSTGCCGPRRPRRTRRATSSGWCRSIPRSSGPTSMRRGLEKGLRDPALGRSRGGLTSKIHLACDGRGRPLGFVVTGGNANGCTRFTAVMEGIRVPRLGPGRPRVRPDHVLGDKGYSSKAIRAWLRRRGIPHTIPERPTRSPTGPGGATGRPPADLRP